jgi:hypothetical protein
MPLYNPAAASPSLSNVSSVSATNATWLDIPLPAGYSRVEIVGTAQALNDIVNMAARVTTDNFSTRDTGASDYHWVYTNKYILNTNLTSGDAGDPSIVLCGAAIGNQPGETAHFTLTILAAEDSASFTTIEFVTSFVNYAAINSEQYTGYGVRKAASVVDGISLNMSAGNITGNAKVYVYSA